MTRARVSAVTCAVMLTLNSCGRHEDADRLAVAIDYVRPHASRFANFENWAKRAYSVADRTASDRALSETLFAPVRRDDAVLATWIRISAGAQRQISLPPALQFPDTRGWTDVRAAALGWVSVARFLRCPIEPLQAQRAAEQPECVVITRTTRSVATSPVQVTMAFRQTAED